MITHDFVCFCPIQKLLLLDDLHKPDAVQEGFTNRLCAYKSLCRSYFMLSLVQVQNSTVLSFSPLMQIFCSHRFSVLIFTEPMVTFRLGVNWFTRMSLTWILFTATKPSVVCITAKAVAWNIVNRTVVRKDSAVKTALGVSSPPVK